MPDSYLLDLTREALTDLDRPGHSVTAVARKAIRIARQRSDWEAVYWLSTELEPMADKEARYRRVSEVAPFFTRDEMRRIHDRNVEQSLTLRSLGSLDAHGEIDTHKVTSLSLPELESFLQTVASSAQPPIPSQVHPHDAVILHERQQNAASRAAFSESEMRKVVARLSQRIHTYLSRVEVQLARGQQQADFFEHNRLYVRQRLKQLSAPALDQLEAAYQRAMEGTDEGRSHALTSCRRALKSLADAVYPARSTPVRGRDGKDRTLDDSKFVSRLWQYLAESSAGSAAKKLLQSEVDQLGSTIDRLNEVSSKGVHDQVTPFEVNTCVLALYSLIGAILRLQSEESAASLDPSSLRTP